ncbi:uncharacterized protein [Henckelia pumila]|uniref:uncharacterized protein n=1 Tax=Henckelia pumila TaxID=405737 RepID=UPI003C6DF50C
MDLMSYYSNWDSFDQHDYLSSDTNDQQLCWELQDFSALANDNGGVDPNNGFFYSSSDQNYINSLMIPNFLTPISHDLNLSNCPAPIISTTQAPLVPFQEFDNPSGLYYPKRQKKAAYIDYEEIYPCSAIYAGVQQFVMPDFPTGPVPVYSTKKSLSAQSIAARQRRRKITDKTQELGKLIPGAHKMNTAEMFHAAYKYIKFLQAQLGILQSMESYYHKESDIEEESVESEEYLHGLVESPLIQEKLYSREKCLAPLKFVQSLSIDEKKQESINKQCLEFGLDNA